MFAECRGLHRIPVKTKLSDMYANATLEWLDDFQHFKWEGTRYSVVVENHGERFEIVRAIPHGWQHVKQEGPLRFAIQPRQHL